MTHIIQYETETPVTLKGIDFADLFLKHSGLLSLVLDNKQNIRCATNACCDQFALDADKIRGSGILDVADGLFDTTEIDALLNNDDSGTTVGTLRVKQGSDVCVKHYLIQKKPFSASDGVTNTLITFQDISEQRRLERRASQLRHRYKEFVYSLDTSIAILTGPDFIIEVANDYLLDQIGRGREIIGQKFFSAVPELKQIGLDVKMRKAFKTGVAYKASEMEVPLLRNGKWETRYYSFIYQPQRDEDGVIIAMAILGFEVTPVALLHQKVANSEVRLQKMLSLMPAKVFTSSKKGKYLYFNKIWSEFTGLSNEQMLKLGWHQLIHHEDLKSYESAWTHSRSTESLFEMEIRIKNKAGAYRWHLVRKTPVFDQNRSLINWICVSTEIHALKKLEKQKSDFLKVASHELKTPVNTVKGYVQLLQELSTSQAPGTEVPNLTEILGIMEGQLSRLTRLINDLLDLNRTEDNILALSKTTFPFEDLVRASAKDLQLANRDIQINLTGDCTCEVLADYDRIGQVIINFVNNAIKYSPKSKKVDLCLDRENDMALLHITDYGIGIQKQHLKNIFKQYFRVSNNENTYSGFGVGLYISKQIIVKHGGILRVDSDLGKGSTFTFGLPITETDT